jgi:hypothetical protein
MKNPKIFIGPMSKNIVDSIIEYSNENNCHLGIIPSRRQIEHDGGYVNSWTTSDFVKYVRDRSKNILIVRDHGGPEQGYLSDDGIDSFDVDCKMFDVVHVDVWKKFKDYQSGLDATVNFIKRGYSINADLLYEVGTEESIRPFTVEEIDNLISDLKRYLNPSEYSKIKYVVVQSGTALLGNKNIGEYKSAKLDQMIAVCNKHGLISKEHNGDYLEDRILNHKFKRGLDSINIAPEFGQIETKIILDEIKNDPVLFNELYSICYESKRWVKWVPEDFDPGKNREEIINISGHYIFSDPRFLEMKKSMSPDIDERIKKSIYKRIERFMKYSSIGNIETVKKYFEYFGDKNTEGLEKIFSENVELADWNISVKGIKEVNDANNNIFNSVENIKVIQNSILHDEDSKKFSCDITIVINNSDTINAVDLIEFNDDGKIISIKAYKK